MPKVCFMTDIESLALKGQCLITVIATAPFLSDHSWRGSPIRYSLNGREQRNRDISFDTILWWFEQDDAAIKSMARSMRSGLNSPIKDMLVAWIQDLHAKAAEFGVQLDECEFWFRGPQFDAVAIETLCEGLGIKAPWKYDKVFDLRTLLLTAGITDLASIETSRTYVKHDAADDVDFQIDCHKQAAYDLGA
jgi:hypothetical protein